MSNPAATSPEFNSADADLNFVSSDSVIFKIHSKNLEYTSGGFAPPGFQNGSQDEMIQLSEDSTTLRLLFAFVYPRQHPDLEGIQLPLLLQVGEAAEKYQVFAALNICRIRIKERVDAAPLEVFIYGFRHGYQDIMDQAIPHFQDIPLDEIVPELPPAMVVPWVRYYESRRSTIMRAFLQSPSAYSHSNLGGPTLFGASPQNPSAYSHSDLAGPTLFGAFPQNPSAYSHSNLGESTPSTFGAPHAVSTRGISNRVLADAMRKFYEKNLATTSVLGLRVALREAFYLAPPPGVQTVRDRSPRPAERADERGGQEFIRQLEEALSNLPPFGSLLDH